MHKKFQIKKGVLCRSFYSKKNEANLDTVYIPTNILKDVIIQIHLEELHPSGRQTYRSFAEHYYHPQAQKITRQICRSCEQCSKIRKQNTEIKYSMHVTRKRSLKPSKPREGLSLDVIELPESNHGYSYGLLISDLFTLYVSFYPMKDNNSAAVANCLERYFSAQRTPKSVYTEDSHVFRGHVSHLLSRFRVTHVTTNLKSRRMSNVESQVKTLRNAYRSTILQSKFFQGHLWCKLFPIVICKMNAAISKYGINRESLYYGELIESSLPLLSDIDIFGPLEEDLEETCRKFRDKMGRFMGKKKRDKTKYRKGKENGICMHELVMREIFLEGQKLAMTYTGPYRVIDICGKGVTLRDLQTGDALSVSFEYVRKMNFDELLTLLPQKFEKEIMEALELLTYEQKGKVKEIDNTDRKGSRKEEEIKEEKMRSLPYRDPRMLCSGKLYTVSIEDIPEGIRKDVRKAYWRKEKIARKGRNETRKSSLVKTYEAEPNLDPRDFQVWDKEEEIYRMYHRDEKGKKWRCEWFPEDPFRDDRLYRNHNYESITKDGKRRTYNSSFRSGHPGTLRLEFEKEDKCAGHVRFSDLTVIFY